MTEDANSIKAISFHDGKALNKALKAAISAVVKSYHDQGREQSVRKLLSMLIEMKEENDSCAAYLRNLAE